MNVDSNILFMRQKFQELIRLNSTNNYDHPFLKPNPEINIPCYAENEFDFLLIPELIGKKHKSLIQDVENSMSGLSEQSYAIVGIVQPYGSGKTRNALSLTEKFVVLPIRFGQRNSISRFFPYKLIEEQELMKKEFFPSGIDNANPIDIRSFSDNCILLTHLSVLSLICFFQEFINDFKDFDINNSLHRFYLSILLISSKEEYTKINEWCFNWFDNILPKFKKDPKQVFKNISTNLINFKNNLGQKIVIVFDEIHETIGSCIGFVLHSSCTGIPNENITINWKNENCGIGENCTDLFYQFRKIMTDNFFETSSLFGVVMCSTAFRTWVKVETDNTTLSRLKVIKHLNIEKLNFSTIKQFILKIFNIEENLIDDNKQILSKLSRPYYFFSFIEALLKEKPENISEKTPEKKWFEDTLSSSIAKFVSNSKENLNALHTSKNSYNDHFVGFYTKLLFLIYRLGGIAKINSDSDIAEIIKSGIVSLEEKDDQIVIADGISEDAIINHPSFSIHQKFYEDKLLENYSIFDFTIENTDKTKGLLCEKVLALIALRNIDDILGTSNCIKSKSHNLFGFNIKEEYQYIISNDFILSNEIYFPSNSLGPDLFYYDESRNRIVAVQSKCTNETLSMSNFLIALDSLSQKRVFKNENDFLNILNSGKSYHRVVYSTKGFVPSVYYFVAEYNLNHQNTPIHLYTINNIQNLKISESLIKQILITCNSTTNTVTEHSVCIYQNQWKSLTPPTKNRINKPKLQSYCQERGIPLSQDKKEFSKDILIKNLDEFDLEPVLKKIKI